MAGVSRVSRAALTACLTCPLCKGYFREASALADCGHTFCRDCIIKKIDEQGIESCPVCNAALGIAPEEKLRVEAKRLPQLVKNFYRIGDGTIQVSSILKLIMKKLELASDVKVEILCHGKPVCPSTTLHCLLKQWLSRKPKYKVQRPVGAPANEFVMELHYRRCRASKSLCCTKKTGSLPCHCST
ncbi:hypothetical protein ZWY2020_017414 [Hordeum vulgare]|nr:hypothetical protein ZWY2020_017414 [Hordeum vulgare]